MINMQFVSHLELLQYVSHCSWKEKINFFTQISQEITETRMQVAPKILQLSWLELLNQTSINVLIKALECLNLFTKTYILQNARVQRDIINRLLELTKMKRQQIDENIAEIICSLIVNEKNASEHGQRHPLSICFDSFSSLNHPTFFYGISEDDAMEDEDTQVNVIEDSYDQHNSFILETLLEALKGCRKEVLILIIKIAHKLTNLNILNPREIESLTEGIQSVKDVIFHRKHVQLGQKVEIESKISEIMNQFAQTS